MDLLDGLAGVLGVDLVDTAARSSSASRAWISMSEAWPWKPPLGWWMRIRLLGSAIRLPGAPPASSSEPMLMAIPKQIVCTSGLMNCMVS